MMGWSIGFDEHWKRDIGYGVPAICDQPGCGAEIDRGLSYVCGGDPYGGDLGCGLYFCSKHLVYHQFRGQEFCTQVCERCAKHRKSFQPTPDTLQWIYFKMTDPSWEEWRIKNGLTPKLVGVNDGK